MQMELDMRMGMHAKNSIANGNEDEHETTNAAIWSMVHMGGDG